jgi:hypothetical protein
MHPICSRFTDIVRDQESPESCCSQLNPLGDVPPTLHLHEIYRPMGETPPIATETLVQENLNWKLRTHFRTNRAIIRRSMN